MLKYSYIYIYMVDQKRICIFVIQKETKLINIETMGTNAKQQNYFTSVWVEVKAQKGIVTKKDEKKISKWPVLNHSKKPSIYLNFKDKYAAIKYLENFDKKLSKRYECRIFTDLQMSKSELGLNGMIIPFTRTQLKEVYYI